MTKLGLSTVVLFAAAMLAQAQTDKVARGKYLAENVAMCGDCHTEHLANGMPNVAKQLRGALLPFKPVVSMPWAPMAPDLTPRGAIWQTFGEAGLVRFLQTGLNPSGNRPNPPMPPYRLSREDAEAIVAYLKTLR
ncbi:MAG TPA: c-type cytochrome [Bryobacteraceae bacterium]|nr:c-type cytochrome [Bryobacteraceae bacterium]